MAISTENNLPERHSLKQLAEAAQKCHGCELYKYATQTVFGQGKIGARVMFVGEQPGDKEDKIGKPFVGPAGKILEIALEEAGLKRDDIYLTNAVKHFKFQERGKRRIHSKPRISEINACFPWLEAEIDAIKPEVIVCLGSTAARAVLGEEVQLFKQRGILIAREEGHQIMVTVHPSSVLRAMDHSGREQMLSFLTEDIKRVARLLD